MRMSKNHTINSSSIDIKIGKGTSINRFVRIPVIRRALPEKKTSFIPQEIKEFGASDNPIPNESGTNFTWFRFQCLQNITSYCHIMFIPVHFDIVC